MFNIGKDVGVSVNQIAEILKGVTEKRKLKNIYEEPRLADSRHGYADISKTEKTLGFHPKFDIKRGLADLVDWYKSSDDLLT